MSLRTSAHTGVAISVREVVSVRLVRNYFVTKSIFRCLIDRKEVAYDFGRDLFG